jgi:hypothetical protein
MYLYETHMHTSPVSACAASSPEEMVRCYRKHGFTGVIVTDHFINGNTSCPQNFSWEKKIEFFTKGFERAKAEGGKCDVDVFFGLEYSYRGTDFLVYGLSPEYLKAHSDFDKLDFENFSAAVRAGGGFLAQAHPFRKEWWIDNPVPAKPEFIDAIEVFNSGMSEEVNKKAFVYAQKHNLPMMAGSDAHCDNMRKPAGISLKNRAENIFEIIDAIKKKQIELVKGKN